MEIALEELRRLRWELLVCNSAVIGRIAPAGTGSGPGAAGHGAGQQCSRGKFCADRHSSGRSGSASSRSGPAGKMASSYFSRMLMLALVLAAGLVISWFDPISVVFPLFFVKISLTVGYIFLGKGGNKN